MSSKQADQRQLERQRVAHSLNVYLQMKSRLGLADIRKYADKIRSGEYEAFQRKVSLALQEEAQQLFADDRPRPSKGGFSPRTAPDKKTLKEVVGRLEELVAQSSASDNQKPFLAMIEPYSPCTTALRDLEVLTLSQLQEESHHRGRVLHVKRTGPLVSGAVVTYMAVIDDNGDAEDVELYHADSTLEEALPSDTFFAIKGPYLTLSRTGITTIRVDHPSDLVLPDALSSSALAVRRQIVSRTASEWKEAGNEYFSQQQFSRAGQAYREALCTGAEGKLKLDVCRNLARVELTLGHYEAAGLHALNAISDGSDPKYATLDGKAYYRAGCASYHLGDFSQAQIHFQKLLGLCPSDEEGRRELERVQQRLAEQEYGQYDFGQMITKLSKKQPRVDIADFRKRTIIGESKGKGRGLFAADDIELGELILFEKAFCATFEWESKWSAIRTYNTQQKAFDAFPATVWTDIVRKLLKTPSQSTEVTDLCSKYASSSLSGALADDKRVLDAMRVHGIIAQNAFAIPKPSRTQRNEAFGVMKTFIAASDTDLAKASIDMQSNCAMFRHASLINHSCLPNATRVFIGDAILLRATRPIAKGEEIFHAYAGWSSNIKDRQSQLELFWGFRCDCGLCLAEIKEPDDTYRHRTVLVDEAEKLGWEIVTNLPGSYQWKEGVRLAEKLHAQLKATYDPATYQYLPRSGLSHIQTALAQVYLLRRQHSACRAVIVEAFDCLGWVLTLHKAGSTATQLLSPKPGCATKLSEDMVPLLAVASRAVQATRQNTLADQLVGLAKKIYITLNGVENGLGSIDEVLGKRG